MPEETKQHSWWQTLPGVLTAAGALLTAVTGLIVVVRHDEQPKVASAQSPPAPAVTPQAPPGRVSTEQASAPPDQAPPTLNISGTWLDNWGTVSLVTQDGSAYHFQAEGKSCTGQYVRSHGDGSIAGSAVHSSYQSTLPSQGSCTGTLSGNGRELSSTCTDSVCGTFVTNSVRQ
jgi:hypothetical protein